MLARAAAMFAVVAALAGCGFTKLGEKITPTSPARQDQATSGAYESVVDITVRQLRAIGPRATLAAQGDRQASLHRTGRRRNATVESINKTLKG
jgi:outer membrane lipopolysaccharide assembly protein LptE/RlpB